jgi:prenylcysteine oxidase/farnesylcysteine lyase
MKKLSLLIALGSFVFLSIAKPEINSTQFESYSQQMKTMSDKYISEVVEAATRVNYGQSSDAIHALEGACSMAATGASGIAGGNILNFEQFIKRTNANLQHKTRVTSIKPKSASSDLWTVKSSRGSTDYKAVILAAPFHSTGITVPTSISEKIQSQPYVNLHVTLLATTASAPSSSYFGLPETTEAPRVMLTSHQGQSKPEFNSLSYHGLVREGEWAVKIFSEQEISDAWLANMFDGKVGWVTRKLWEAYPVLPPTTSFPPVKLDKGFYYVNAFEPLISTMETETVSSRNVVDLLLKEEFDSSICGQHVEAEALEPSQVLLPLNDDKDFVLGFDC